MKEGDTITVKLQEGSLYIRLEDNHIKIISDSTKDMVIKPVSGNSIKILIK